MKRRSGFVSNSSSTSFTCDVCGTTESGMDACAEDLGFVQCVKGHVFCQDHEIEVGSDGEPSVDEKRQSLISRWEQSTWATDEDKAKYIHEIKEYDDEQVEEEYEDWVRDEGVDSKRCPICQFVNFDKDELLTYLLKVYNLDRTRLLQEVKDKFGTHDKFKKFLTAKE